MSATWTNPTDRTQGDLISASDWNNLIGEDGSLDYANNLRGRKNFIINGNFDLWQRGSSLTGETAEKYLCDRWVVSPSGATYSYQRGTFSAGQTDVPNNPTYFANITVTGANDNLNIRQPIEDVRNFSSQTITISFWAKYTTNAPTNFSVRVRQYFGSGGSSQVDTDFATGQTLTTSWQKFTITGTLPSISGKSLGTGHYVAIFPFLNPNNETYDFQIAQVQLEKGTVATDFELRPLAEELALCQRYFEIAGSGSIGRCTSSTNIQGIGGQWKVNKRTAPTLTLSDTSIQMGEIAVAARTSSGSSLSSFHAADEYGVGDIGINGFSSLTSPNMVGMRQNFLNVDAEL